MLTRTTLCAVACVSFGGRALAADHMRFELVSAYDQVAKNGEVWLGLRQIPDKGWHTYWINPGDVGLPAEVDWKLPKGVTAGQIQWPAPERLLYSGAMTYGYAQPATLMIRLRNRSALKAGASLPIAAHVRSLVCAEVCEPVDADVRLALKVGEDARSGAGRLREALAALPRTLKLKAQTTREGGQMAFAFASPLADADARRHFKAPAGAYLFVEQASLLAPTARQEVLSVPRGFVIRATDPDARWPTGGVAGVLKFADGAAYRVSLDAPASARGP